MPISNILAQIFLKNFDDYFSKKLSSNLYLRYVDDIIIFGKSDCSSFLKAIQKRLIKIGLSINEEKTRIGNLDKGVDFLGYSIGKDKISIVNKTIESQINKIAAKITWYKKGLLNPKARPNWLINNDRAFKKAFLKEVNLIITGSKSAKKNYGWLFYYLEIDDLSVFYKIDSIIESMFESLESFGGRPPKSLKRTIRAYFEIKYNKGGNYIYDYDKLNVLAKKRKFLQDVGQADPSKEYSEIEIEKTYENYRDRSLRNLERDIGYGY